MGQWEGIWRRHMTQIILPELMNKESAELVGGKQAHTKPKRKSNDLMCHYIPQPPSHLISLVLDVVVRIVVACNSSLLTGHVNNGNPRRLGDRGRARSCGCDGTHLAVLKQYIQRDAGAGGKPIDKTVRQIFELALHVVGPQLKGAVVDGSLQRCFVDLVCLRLRRDDREKFGRLFPGAKTKSSGPACCDPAPHAWISQELATKRL